MKPERAWKVGDKTFPDYETARQYAAQNRAALQRDELIAALREALDPYSEATADNADDIADHVLKKFTFRKRAQ